ILVLRFGHDVATVRCGHEGVRVIHAGNAGHGGEQFRALGMRYVVHGVVTDLPGASRGTDALPAAAVEFVRVGRRVVPHEEIVVDGSHAGLCSGGSLRYRYAADPRAPGVAARHHLLHVIDIRDAAAGDGGEKQHSAIGMPVGECLVRSTLVLGVPNPCHFFDV